MAQQLISVSYEYYRGQCLVTFYETDKQQTNVNVMFTSDPLRTTNKFLKKLNYWLFFYSKIILP